MKSKAARISFRSMKQGDEAVVVDFVLEVFTEFVAPQYSNEGIAEFRKFVNVNALLDRFVAGNPITLAESGRKIIGVIEMRDNSHIALLFIEKSYQLNGIAKKLINEGIKICRTRNQNIKSITVNSSPNAFDAYQNIGFKGGRNEKTVNGIRFIPMELVLDNNVCSQPENSADPKSRAAD
jgi:ribosomal protein S18 acetylase RimI-like enzyme